MINCKCIAFQAVDMYPTSWIKWLICAASIVTLANGSREAIYGDHYYVLNKYHVGWETAAKACRADGGYLVSIHTPEEQTFVYDLHTTNTDEPVSLDELRVWIGLQCKPGTSCDGAHWEDGTALNYTAWWRQRKFSVQLQLYNSSDQ